MRLNGTLGMGVIMCAGTMAAASGVGDIAGFVNNPRLFNDFGGSTLTFESAFSASGSSVDLREENYGTGGFANRHAAWFGDGGTNKVDFNYDDAWDMQMTMHVNSASGVGNVEAGFGQLQRCAHAGTARTDDNGIETTRRNAGFDGCHDYTLQRICTVQPAQPTSHKIVNACSSKRIATGFT